jgi:hypothetical protein
VSTKCTPQPPGIPPRPSTSTPSSLLSTESATLTWRSLRQRWLGVWVCCAVASFLCIACYINLALWTSPVAVTLAGCALNSLRGAFFPIMTTEVNRVLPSERRATALSIKGLGYNVLFSSFSQVGDPAAPPAPHHSTLRRERWSPLL